MKLYWKQTPPETTSQEFLKTSWTEDLWKDTSDKEKWSCQVALINITSNEK